MPLWGTSADAITNRPKWCPTDEDSMHNRGDVYATQSGWVRKAGTAATGNGNTSADPEILVAIGGLAGASGTVGLKAPTPVACRFVTTSHTNGTSKTMTVEITYDEAVTVATSNPTIVIANGNQSTDGDGNATLTYSSALSTANQLQFTNTGLTLSTNDVYTLGGGSQANIVLASSSTISDTVVGGTTLAASLVLTALPATTITVTAS